MASYREGGVNHRRATREDAVGRRAMGDGEGHGRATEGGTAGQ